MSEFLVLLLTATAKDGSGWPSGSFHKIIAIVSASNFEEAREIALAKLEASFWSNANFEKCRPLLVDTANQDYLRSAIATAQEHGFGFIVYDTKH